MIELIFPVFFVAAGLVLVSVMTSALAYRFGAPLLLVFLAIGLMAGEDGLGITYDDANSAYLIGSLALSIILFDSGFDTKLRSFKQAAAPACGFRKFPDTLSGKSRTVISVIPGQRFR